MLSKSDRDSCGMAVTSKNAGTQTTVDSYVDVKPHFEAVEHAIAMRDATISAQGEKIAALEREKGALEGDVTYLRGVISRQGNRITALAKAASEGEFKLWKTKAELQEENAKLREEIEGLLERVTYYRRTYEGCRPSSGIMDEFVPCYPVKDTVVLREKARPLLNFIYEHVRFNTSVVLHTDDASLIKGYDFKKRLTEALRAARKAGMVNRDNVHAANILDTLAASTGGWENAGCIYTLDELSKCVLDPWTWWAKYTSGNDSPAPPVDAGDIDV